MVGLATICGRVDQTQHSRTGKINVKTYSTTYIIKINANIVLICLETDVVFVISFNRGGEEPNDYGGDPEECTFVIPETPGRLGSLVRAGPMWGDINCMAKEFSWPENPESHIHLAPICEGNIHVK